ncbi:hypothetical protein GGR56DRAFT_673419 [Xylariaceae sp. FL0804]|nr:hypothetical protein GGR56DRAFT_673419 [Xylariaceae sp. FL0804]
MSTASLVVPERYRVFEPFTRLPEDLRYMVWQKSIFYSGIHFLSFVETDDQGPHGNQQILSGHQPILPLPGSGGNSDGDGGGDGEPAGRASNFSATLQPTFPLPKADKSYYVIRNEAFSRLSQSCREARDVVAVHVAHANNLTLDGGQLVVLDGSSDVVCISHPDVLSSGHLGRWAARLDGAQLARIRRLVVRYSRSWETDAQVCPSCGRRHEFAHVARPHHVYELAALFENLETFYFLDSFAVRQPALPGQPLCQEAACRAKKERFASAERGRAYVDVDPHTCLVFTAVWRTLGWVRRNYLRHCRLRSRGPERPEAVQFKVMTCEWDEAAKLKYRRYRYQQSRATHSHPAPPRRSRPSPSLSLSLSLSALTDAMRNLRLDGGPDQAIVAASSSLPVFFGDGGRSKFDFTFESHENPMEPPT